MKSNLEIIPREEETPNQEVENIKISYNGVEIANFTSKQTAILECANKRMVDNVVVTAVAGIVILEPPIISATDTAGELMITNPVANEGLVAKWGIYKVDGTFVKYIVYTGNPQHVNLNSGTEYQVTAISASGIESAKSNIAETKTCFVAGTPVLMSDGSYKMIEDIRAGDKVQSFNLDTSRYCEGTVTEVVTGYTDRIAMVLFEDGNYVAMSEGHPLYTVDGWHSITNKDGYSTLVVGDRVLGAFGYIEITNLQVVDVEPTMVYSLSVSIEGSQQSMVDGVYFAGAGIMALHGGGSN
jgi:hypothetical protein